MPASVTNPPLAPEIRAALDGLRRRIRAYVTVEGISTAVIWVAATFWLALAVDYLPILVGATELPQAVRAIVLLAVVTVLAVIIYRQVVRRLLVRLADRSMAILLERRYRHFRDSLVTTVELASGESERKDYSPEMLGVTTVEAARQIGDVRLSQLFNLRPLAMKLVTATALVASLIGFSLINGDLFAQAAQRIWMLDAKPWPRRAKIEVVGIEVARPAGTTASAVASAVLPFTEGAVKVARGASFTLRVRADAGADVVPEVCTVHYRTADGDRGRVPMKRIGRERSEEIDGTKRRVQWYAFDGKPFKGILSSVDFDVVGFDHRVGGYQVQVVESPSITETKLDCLFPEYLVDEATSSWLPRTVDYLPSGTQLPRGTRITVKARASKELRRVVVHNPDTQETTTLEITGSGEAAQRFEMPIAGLDVNQTLEITLLDRDNVYSDRPHRIAIGAIPDEAPRVDSRLKGIGSAITPDVIVPIRGKISDDYALAKSWVELQVNDREQKERPFTVQPKGDVETEIDFRELRSEPNGLEIKATDKLRVRVAAADKFKLGDAGPNVGSGEQYELDVVTPEELLRLLEARELGLRRRFEQIIEEVTELRDSLLRVKVEVANRDTAGAGDSKEKPAAKGAEPGDDEVDPQTAAERARSLRLLRVQRASTQSQKSNGEVMGVAASFAEIREELINNRVDTEDRKNRLKEQISDPLTQVVTMSFPELDRRLAALEKMLDDRATAPEAADQAVQQAELVLTELNDVLQKMLDLETFNELLDIVRDLIKEQNDVIERTKQQKKRQLLDLTQ